MQFQHRSNSHALFLAAVLPQVHVLAAPQHTGRVRNKTQVLAISPSFPASSAAAIVAAPVANLVAPQALTHANELCDWESWLDAGGDLLMGEPD